MFDLFCRYSGQYTNTEFHEKVITKKDIKYYKSYDFNKIQKANSLMHDMYMETQLRIMVQ